MENTIINKFNTLTGCRNISPQVDIRKHAKCATLETTLTVFKGDVLHTSQTFLGGFDSLMKLNIKKTWTYFFLLYLTSERFLLFLCNSGINVILIYLQIYTNYGNLQQFYDFPESFTKIRWVQEIFWSFNLLQSINRKTI